MTKQKTNIQSTEDGPLDRNFEKLVKDTLELWHVPGVSVAVVDGKNTWTKGYGISSFPSTPVTPSTLFYTGSTTKAFTAAIMSFLVDDNEKYPQLQWDTPIKQLIHDDFLLENDYATNHTTIEDVLSHRSGLASHDRALGGPGATIQSIVRSLRHIQMAAEPRTKYQYCNAMFIVASHVIETVTGRKLGDLMREWIWKPLGMDSTFFELESAKNAKEDLAHGCKYRYDSVHGGFEEVEWTPVDEVSGAGAVISNVLDYAKWARAILNNSTPMSKQGFEAIFTPRTLIPIEEPFTGPRSYALGWRMGVYHGQRFYEHSGGMIGFGAQLLIFPDIIFAVVALANTSGTSNFVDQALAYHLVDEKLNLPLEERFDWNRRNQSIISRGKHKSENPKSIYPSIPDPILPLTLPLQSYTGIYRHPAYGNLTIYNESSVTSNSSPVNKPPTVPSSHRLRADRLKILLPEQLTFEHVSGEFFVARSKHLEDFGALFDDIYLVEFRMGANEMVKEVGIGWEESMGKDKIWLQRVVEEQDLMERK